MPSDASKYQCRNPAADRMRPAKPVSGQEEFADECMPITIEETQVYARCNFIEIDS